MPYIDVKVTSVLNEDEKTALKDGLGQIITRIPGKSEAVTMIGLTGGYDLFLGGKSLVSGAYVEVKAFNEVPREYKELVNTGIFELLTKVLSVPSKNVYITYYDQNEWGCNGSLL